MNSSPGKRSTLLQSQYQINSLEELDALVLDFKKQILGSSSNFKNQIFNLEAEMGAGKTTFIRKLVQSFDPKLAVASPTFTGLHLYKSTELDFYHYDLYQVALSLEEFQEILDDGQKKVIFFEWGQNLSAQTKSSFLRADSYFQTIQIDILDDEVRVFEIF